MKTRFFAILLIASLAGSAIPVTAQAKGFLEQLFGNVATPPTPPAGPNRPPSPANQAPHDDEWLVITTDDSFLTDEETRHLNIILDQYQKETGKTVKLYVGGGLASNRYIKELRTRGVYGKGTDIALYVTLSPNDGRRAFVQFAGPIYRSHGKVIVMKEENGRDAIGYMVEILLGKTRADAVD